MLLFANSLFVSIIISCTTAEITGIHLPIRRRGGRLSRHEPANLTRLSALLTRAEERYARTYTDVDGNRIVRRWYDGPSSSDDYMLNGAGGHGSWYTTLELGEPKQKLEADLDMLRPDFYTIMTTSGEGSKYDTFLSSTHKSSKKYAHDICLAATDLFHLPSSSSSTAAHLLTFPMCQPQKYTHHTLQHSGTVLGLSPPGGSRSLTRLTTPTLVEQLLAASLIQHNIFSLTLLSPDTGILSLGSSIAPQVEETKIRNELNLKYINSLHMEGERAKMEEEIDGAMNFAMPPGSTHDDHFKWTAAGAEAAAGWHTTLVSGVWVNGVKVLKNQPVLLDINCPVVLVPPAAAQVLYDAIPGARSLRSLLDEGAYVEGIEAFHAFPCLNAADIQFEIAGWRFPFASGEGTPEDTVHGPVGGPLSLGQVDVNSLQGETGPDGAIAIAIGTGYCVGNIVETFMGTRQKWARSGMKHVWVLGEPFFQGLGVAFDMGDAHGKGQRIGVRTY